MADDDLETSSDFDDIWNALVAHVLALAEALIAEGRIDPSGKTRDEVLREASALIVSDESQLEKLKIWISHEERLLSEARRYVSLGDVDLALLMYATALEHQLNFLLMWAANTAGLSPESCQDLIRTASIHQKTGVTWRLFFGGDLEVATAIRRVAAERNSFVHYKWRTRPLDNPPESSRAELVDLAERATSSLDAIYSQAVLGGHERLR